MSDELIQGMLHTPGLRVVLASTSDLARHARSLQQASATSAELFAQALTAAVLMGSLQKEKSRINLQLECEGPLRGLFADADNEGNARGYVKNPHVDMRSAQGTFEWRPALGNGGFLSVLRDLGGGDYYRSAVELQRFHLTEDLERYFEVSEQLPTVVLVECVPSGSEPLGKVAGALIQTLPGGDLKTLGEWRTRLGPGGALRRALAEGDGNARALLRTLFGDGELEVMQSFPVSYRCSCSKERVLTALITMGKAEIEDVLEKDKKADVTCHFCSTRYVITEEELRELASKA